MAINKRIRFEVFKRDGFVCQYCGKHPPEAMLEVDHIKPKSKKGEDDINNLITSCFDCNRGKSNIELKKIPNSLLENKEIIEEREKQYLEYHRLIAKLNRRINKEIDEIDLIYNKYFERYKLSDDFKRNTVKMFINKLGLFEVAESMENACYKFKGSKQFYETGIPAYQAVIKYFCGICWNKIKANE